LSALLPSRRASVSQFERFDGGARRGASEFEELRARLTGDPRDCIPGQGGRYRRSGAEADD
jgi:hypothetical protein